jgi:hypothetical protein
MLGQESLPLWQSSVSESTLEQSQYYGPEIKCQHLAKPRDMFVLLTAAVTWRFPLVEQLCGIRTMTESWTGNPTPLFEKVVVSPPVSATTTVNEDIDDTAGIFELKE